ncbi:ethanolamine ammonia-lyase subunit EutC [Pontibacter diazotrophicus]|uniref:Ethanolamine ammonia-lyase small subunit n=1 Tax=Pontibacter diazotrophicus TaxID=1400979 RepID=A0A3D8LIE4_9BACT|nr:ethanolamine ammonia-lyase subunit EutC [Pontibacter diazotrophicus]RDV17177.1 ethanolamine ammonia-lyase subunit EutC [Pontibacter diazotrophicus]
MDKPKRRNTETDPWSGLKMYTAARIALGRTGTSVPLKESFAFKMAHAHARDAVYSSLNLEVLLQGLHAFNLPVHVLHSMASDRMEYLQRPDLGRMLNQASSEQLKEEGSSSTEIAFVLADGLSATAVNEHAIPLLQLLVPALRQAGFTLAPLTVAEQARVAIADEIGELLHAKLSIIMIGERPGLSSPDSLGVYFTYAPKPGLTDEARNCISNIRPEGLPYSLAAEKILYLIQEAMRKKLTGVKLKDGIGLLQG